MPGLVVDIVDLPQQAGSTKNIHLEEPAPADLGTEVIGVQKGTPVVLDASLTSVEDGVLVRACTRVHIHGECVRCLRDLDEDRTIAFDELYLLPEARAAQIAQGDEEAEGFFLVGPTSLDLEPALRDALVLELPFRPLCRPDCAGLCSQCGERLDDLEAGHSHEVLDPRWSALAGLLTDADRPQSGGAGTDDPVPDGAGVQGPAPTGAHSCREEA